MLINYGDVIVIKSLKENDSYKEAEKYILNKQLVFKQDKTFQFINDNDNENYLKNYMGVNCMYVKAKIFPLEGYEFEFVI